MCFFIKCVFLNLKCLNLGSVYKMKIKRDVQNCRWKYCRHTCNIGNRKSNKLHTVIQYFTSVIRCVLYILTFSSSSHLYGFDSSCQNEPWKHLQNESITQEYPAKTSQIGSDLGKLYDFLRFFENKFVWQSFIINLYCYLFCVLIIIIFLHSKFRMN